MTRGGDPRQVHSVLAGARPVTESAKDSLGARLAAWANTWGDSKTDTILDSLIAEARKVGWLP